MSSAILLKTHFLLFLPSLRVLSCSSCAIKTSEDDASALICSASLNFCTVGISTQTNLYQNMWSATERSLICPPREKFCDVRHTHTSIICLAKRNQSREFWYSGRSNHSSAHQKLAEKTFEKAHHYLHESSAVVPNLLFLAPRTQHSITYHRHPIVIWTAAREKASWETYGARWQSATIYSPRSTCKQ